MGLIGEETSGNFKTYHFDYRGSTVAITNASGTVTDTFEYDTYGKLTAHSGSNNTQFLYNGRDGVLTEDTGLIYMRARYYSTALRRFVNADKVHGDITNALTLNRYAFVNGNPAVNVDPLGLSAERGGAGSTVSKTNYLPYNMLYIRPIPIELLELINNKLEKLNISILNKCMKIHSYITYWIDRFLRESCDSIKILADSSMLHQIGGIHKTENVNILSVYDDYKNNKLDPGGERTRNVIINGQEREAYANYLNGLSTVGESGCEAIAIHNSRVLLGMDSTLNESLYMVNKNSANILFGFWGTNAYSLSRVLDDYEMDYKEVGSDNLTDNGVYIVSFWNDTTPSEGYHTVAMTNNNGYYTVYNDYNKAVKPFPGYNITEIKDNYITGYYLGELP